MRKSLFVIALLWAGLVQSQTLYMTRNGQISFSSKTPLENIDAVNNEVTSMLNPETGDLAFAVLIKSFHFDRALMEEHFNENYMESGKYPKATFSGKIMNLDEIDLKKAGKYAVRIDGNLEIHGVKKEISASGNLEIVNDKIQALSAFQIKPEDYDIKIPAIVSEQIAKSIEIKVNCQYEPKK